MPNESKQHDVHTAATSFITSKLIYFELVPVFKCPRFCPLNRQTVDMIYDIKYLYYVSVYSTYANLVKMNSQGDHDHLPTDRL